CDVARERLARRCVSVGVLFPGAVVPALLLVGLSLLLEMGVAIVNPKACPPIPAQPDAPKGLALASHLAEALAAPILLIVLVLGSILAGLATPTEAAALGAFGALVLASRKVGGARSWATTLAALA